MAATTALHYALCTEAATLRRGRGLIFPCGPVDRGMVSELGASLKRGSPLHVMSVFDGVVDACCNTVRGEGLSPETKFVQSGIIDFPSANEKPFREEAMQHLRISYGRSAPSHPVSRVIQFGVCCKWV